MNEERVNIDYMFHAREEARKKLVIFYKTKCESVIKEKINLMEKEITKIFPSVPKSIRLEIAADIIFHEIIMNQK